MSESDTESYHDIVRILVADDNPLVMRNLCKVLCRRYEVVSAEDGNQAMDAALAEPVELAVLDIEMPGHTGIEVARSRKRAARSVPVVLISGHLEAYGALMEGLSNVAATLAKPFRIAQLSELIEQVLHSVC